MYAINVSTKWFYQSVCISTYDLLSWVAIQHIGDVHTLVYLVGKILNITSTIKKQTQVFFKKYCNLHKGKLVVTYVWKMPVPMLPMSHFKVQNWTHFEFQLEIFREPKFSGTSLKFFGNQVPVSKETQGQFPQWPSTNHQHVYEINGVYY